MLSSSNRPPTARLRANDGPTLAAQRTGARLPSVEPALAAAHRRGHRPAGLEGRGRGSRAAAADEALLPPAGTPRAAADKLRSRLRGPGRPHRAAAQAACADHAATKIGRAHV